MLTWPAMLDRARMKMRKRRQAGLLSRLCYAYLSFLCHSLGRLLRLPFFLVIFLFGGKRFFIDQCFVIFLKLDGKTLVLWKRPCPDCVNTLVNSRSRIRKVWTPNIIDSFIMPNWLVLFGPMFSWNLTCTCRFWRQDIPSYHMYNFSCTFCMPYYACGVAMHHLHAESCMQRRISRNGG